jgi:methylated-DNA-[protein]-cysteine S-methyltransferase
MISMGHYIEEPSIMKIYLAELNSPIGTLYVASSDQGVVCLSLSGRKDLLKNLQNRLSDMELEQNAVKNRDVIKQMKEYFSGARKRFDLPLHMMGTEFQKRVWRQLCQVPFGQTASYKEIAEKIGKPKAMRAVGQANHQNLIPIIIPCHRIIGANGDLVGFGGGVDLKRFLLSHEGVL